MNDGGQDTHQLSAGVALDGLRLAVSRIVVWTTALEAVCRPVVLNAIIATSEAASEATSASASRRGRGSTLTWGWAVACKMTNLTTAVAAAALRTTNAQSWAVSLDVSQALAVVALLG